MSEKLGLRMEVKPFVLMTVTDTFQECLTSRSFYRIIPLGEEAISMKMSQNAVESDKTFYQHEYFIEKDAPFSNKIDFIKSLILDSVNQEVIKKVYLFGSYAYGEPSEDSDIDLCVVIGNEYKRADIYLDIALNLYENKIIPCDLLVYNEKYFVGAESGRGIENTIINRGMLLYG